MVVQTNSGDQAIVQAAPAEIEVMRTAQSRLPTRHGEFTLHVFQANVLGAEPRDAVEPNSLSPVARAAYEHAVLVKGDVAQDDVLVRLHSECLTGDILGSLRCDCGEQLALAMQRIEALGCGVLIYLRGQEGRGIGLTQKVRAYALQDAGMDTVDANAALGLPIDSRRYEIAAAILRDLGVKSVRLMSNNPLKIMALEQAGVRLTRESHAVDANPENQAYLSIKRDRLGHWLD